MQASGPNATLEAPRPNGVFCGNKGDPIRRGHRRSVEHGVLQRAASPPTSRPGSSALISDVFFLAGAADDVLDACRAGAPGHRPSPTRPATFSCSYHACARGSTASTLFLHRQPGRTRGRAGFFSTRAPGLHAAEQPAFGRREHADGRRLGQFRSRTRLTLLTWAASSAPGPAARSSSRRQLSNGVPTTDDTTSILSRQRRPPRRRAVHRWPPAARGRAAWRQAPSTLLEGRRGPQDRPRRLEEAVISPPRSRTASPPTTVQDVDWSWPGRSSSTTKLAAGRRDRVRRPTQYPRRRLPCVRTPQENRVQEERHLRRRRDPARSSRSSAPPQRRGPGVQGPMLQSHEGISHVPRIEDDRPDGALRGALLAWVASEGRLRSARAGWPRRSPNEGRPGERLPKVERGRAGSRRPGPRIWPARCSRSTAAFLQLDLAQRTKSPVDPGLRAGDAAGSPPTPTAPPTPRRTPRPTPAAPGSMTPRSTPSAARATQAGPPPSGRP